MVTTMIRLDYRDQGDMTVTLIRVLPRHRPLLPPLPPLVLPAYPKLRGEQCVEFIMLSDREREVMLLVAKGLRNKEIAQRLQISNGTVKVHLHRIYGKLGIRNRTSLAMLSDRLRHPKNGYH
jgi:two-component system nitrate/nitrite response regulator NarL